jgi:MoxR-like ATPase
MPSDILGSETLDNERNFRFIKGPVFSNIVLADEINRTPPKTQSALLEAMQEKTVTIAGQNYPLDKPFFVLATQNPIEQEGTYPLPEAQLDRFMFNIILDYPSFESEIQIIKATTGGDLATANPVLSKEDIIKYQKLVRRVPIADNVIDYVVKTVNKTRKGNNLGTEYTNKYIDWGAGPRASQYLVLGAKCHALLNGKFSPDIEDVQAVVVPILRHRIVRNFKAEADGVSVDEIISNLL